MHIPTPVSNNDHDLKFKSNHFVCSLILDEIRTNHSDSMLITCKDGVSVFASKLLMAAVAPYLADALKVADSDDSFVALPDVEAADLDVLISLILDSSRKSLDKEQQIIHVFDGLFWENGYLAGYLKKEELVEFVTVDDFIKTEDVEGLTNNSLSEKLKDGDRDSDNDIKHENISSPQIEEHECSSPDSPLPKLAVGTRLRKKRKLKDTSPEPKRTKKKRASKETKRTKNMKTKSQQRSTCSFETISPDDPRIQNEDFQAAQARLKVDLEDVYNLEDPRLAWHKHHGLNPKILQIRYQDKHPPLVCPICYIYIPPQNANMCYGNRMPSFFNHLRDHKYFNYVCSCEPRGKGTEHLELVHWKWMRCSMCPKVFHPAHESRHMNFSHKKPLVCQFCSRVVITQCYWNHMDSHNMDKTCRLCDSDVEFKSLRQREHHLQMVHIKRKVCCNLCYFICLTDTELISHKEEYHSPKVKGRVVVKRTTVVCDTCGDEVRKRDYSWHKKKHDSRLTRCRVCDKEMPLRNLTRHMKDVHNPREVCTICGVEVKKMKSHVAIFHTPYDQAKHKCELCRKCFDSSSSLKNHNMNMHLKLRPYKCRYGCEFAYNDTSNRNSHEKKKHGQLFTALDKKETIDLKS